AFATSTGGDPISNPEWSTFLLRSMLANDSFKTYFINRFADLINTAYLPNRVNTVIDQMKAEIEPEIEEHWQRWNNISSLGNWQAQIDVMTDFATNRPDFQRDHIRAKFNIAQNVTATLDCNDQHGFIKMNTIDITASTPGVTENPYPWSGVYFSGIPVTLKAFALPGYTFSHWSGASNSTDAEVTLTPDADFSITAHFVESATTDRVPVYFWMIDSSVVNDTPLLSLDASYEASNQASLEFQSA